VIGVNRSVKVGLVTTHAVCRSIGIIARGVARRTIRNIVPLRQREEAVVDRGRTPAGNRRVATCTVGAEARSLVIRVNRSVKVGLVAAYAICRSIGVITCRVTRCAIRNIVALRQREEAVVDRGRTPSRYGGVATCAIRGEA
jgi:hypothetical protein